MSTTTELKRVRYILERLLDNGYARYLISVETKEVEELLAAIPRTLAGRTAAHGEPSKEAGLPLDFSKPLETVGGRPVEYIGNGVIEYECARVCVDQATGVVYSSPYHGLRIRNVQSAGSAEQVSDVMRALKDACNVAMRNTLAASVPECGDFGAIAQNLDWAIGEIERACPVGAEHVSDLEARELIDFALEAIGTVALHDFKAAEELAAKLRRLAEDEPDAAIQHTAPAPSKAGEWTDERIVKAVRDAFATGRIALTFVNHEGIEKPTDVAKSFVRALSSAPAQAQSEKP